MNYSRIETLLDMIIGNCIQMRDRRWHGAPPDRQVDIESGNMG
jgi:hypothetical protein